LSDGFNQQLQAEANFRKALEISPHYANAMLGLGVSQYRRGQWDAALGTFRADADLEPNNPYVYAWMGETLLHLHLVPEDREFIDKADAMHPGAPLIQQAGADLRQRGG